MTGTGGLPGDFWRVLGSAAFANLADGIAAVAMPLAAVRLGASPAQLAGVVFAQRLPMVALGLIAGGLADGIDRRRTMVSIQVLRVAVLAALVALAVSGNLSLAGLMVAGVVLGIGEAFFDTNMQAMLPMISGRDRLVAANSRLATVETILGGFLGPPVGGLLVAIRIPVAFGSAAIGFAVAALGLLLVRGPYGPRYAVERRNLAVEIAEGVRFLAAHRLLLSLTGMVALLHFGSAAVYALQALHAVSPGPMGLTEAEFGLLLVATNLGSLAGTVVTRPLVERLGRARVLLLAVVGFGTGHLAPALTSNVGVVGLGFFVAGLALMVFSITKPVDPTGAAAVGGCRHPSSQSPTCLLPCRDRTPRPPRPPD